MSDPISPPAGTPQLSPRKYVVLVIILCVFGGVQYWQSRNAPPNNNKPASTTVAPPEAPHRPESRPKTSDAGESPDDRTTKSLPDSKHADAPAKDDRAKDAKAADEKSYRVDRVSIKNLAGEVVYTGTVDLTATIERIKDGKILQQFRDDGIVFQNREGRLPRHEAGYYHEFVHPTPKLSGPGPQRVISGKGGEFWYTPDHYKEFERL